MTLPATDPPPIEAPPPSKPAVQPPVEAQPNGVVSNGAAKGSDDQRGAHVQPEPAGLINDSSGAVQVPAQAETDGDRAGRPPEPEPATEPPPQAGTTAQQSEPPGSTAEEEAPQDGSPEQAEDAQGPSAPTVKQKAPKNRVRRPKGTYVRPVKVVIQEPIAKPTAPSAEPSDGESSGGSVDEGELALERKVTEGVDSDLAEVRSMPEMANIVEFLFVFRKQLKLTTCLTFNSLTDALVLSAGPGMLAQLHCELLRGMGASKLLTERTWQHFVSHRLQYVWQHYGPAYHPPPFSADKHTEAQAYADLPARDRVLTLKALCDLRAERDDLRYLIEEAVEAADGPSSTRSKASKQPSEGAVAGPSKKKAADEDSENVLDLVDVSRIRREPWGVDGSGFVYHYLDWYAGAVEDATDWGFLLAREPTPAAAKARAGVKAEDSQKPAEEEAPVEAKHPYQRYRLPADVVAGTWEVLATSLDELQAFGAKLQRSLRPADKKIADQVNASIADLKGRIEEQEKWRKAKERTRKMLGLGTDVGSLGSRPQRQRKQVSYHEDVYEEPTEGRKRGRSSGSKAAAKVEEEPSGRRGRSRGSATDLIALDMGMRPSRAGRSRKASTTPGAGEGEGAEDMSVDPAAEGGEEEGSVPPESNGADMQE